MCYNQQNNSEGFNDDIMYNNNFKWFFLIIIINFVWYEFYMYFDFIDFFLIVSKLNILKRRKKEFV